MKMPPGVLMSVRTVGQKFSARILPDALAILATTDEPEIATVRRNRQMLEELARVKAAAGEIDGHIVTISRADFE